MKGRRICGVHGLHHLAVIRVVLHHLLPLHPRVISLRGEVLIVYGHPHPVGIQNLPCGLYGRIYVLRMRKHVPPGVLRVPGVRYLYCHAKVPGDFLAFRIILELNGYILVVYPVQQGLEVPLEELCTDNRVEELLELPVVLLLGRVP